MSKEERKAIKQHKQLNKIVFLFLVVSISWTCVGFVASLIALGTSIVLYGILYYLLIYLPKKFIEQRESSDEPLI